MRGSFLEGEKYVSSESSKEILDKKFIVRIFDNQTSNFPSPTSVGESVSDVYVPPNYFKSLYDHSSILPGIIKIKSQGGAFIYLTVVGSHTINIEDAIVIPKWAKKHLSVERGDLVSMECVKDANHVGTVIIQMLDDLPSLGLENHHVLTSKSKIEISVGTDLRQIYIKNIYDENGNEIEFGLSKGDIKIVVD